MINCSLGIADRLAVACCLVLFAGCVSGFSGQEILTLEDSLASIEKPGQGIRTLLPEQRDPDLFTELAKGRNLEQAGKYAKARPIYERLITGYPRRHEAYHRLGVVADHQRRHREAQALYTQAIRLNPNDPELFNDLGYCLYLQGKLEKAEIALLKAVALRPASSRYRNNLGMVYAHLGRYEEALEQFRRGGSEADAYYNLAFIHASREDIEKAKECFRLALAVDPAHEPTRRALTSFECHEDGPCGLIDNSTVAEEGVCWVPYVEGSQAEPSDAVEPASLSVPLSSSGVARVGRPNTQALLKRARALTARRTAGRRE